MQGQNIKYIQTQLGHASIQTTLDRYGHLLKEAHTEQATKLDNILGFGRKMVEMDNKKGLEEAPNPLIFLVAGRGFEPLTFGL